MNVETLMNLVYDEVDMQRLLTAQEARPEHVAEARDRMIEAVAELATAVVMLKVRVDAVIKHA